jgi:leader peptidase (prepilin peptidase)/N-methyltransferase
MSGPGGTVEWLVVATAGVVGLLVGSFLNVVVYRAPLGLSVSTPRSFCPTCDRTLSWWENIPVVSWMALRGQCHTCRQPISIRYPLVEVTTGAAFALVARAWHGNALTAGYAILAATAIAAALIEYSGSRTPLSVGAVGGAAGAALTVVAALWLDRPAIAFWSVVGLLAGGAAFAALRIVDPECRDPRWHGRAMLPVICCWLGGIGATSGRAAVAGSASWILAEFVCIAMLRTAGRAGAPLASNGSRHKLARGTPWSVASVPLVTGMIVAMAVSLVVAG